MSFDTLIMKAVTDELQAGASGAQVQRVFEPGREEIIFQLYNRGEQLNLLFSIDPAYARVHLTGKRGWNRDQPSPFCMLLRKYLVGGRAVSFSSPPLERILQIDFDPPEGLPPVKLTAEIMGRRSNLVLIDENEIILGAARTVSRDKNPLRAIMPGEKYVPVPSQDKLDPLKMQEQEFRNAFRKQLEDGKNSQQALVGAVTGISPPVAVELLSRSGFIGTKFGDPEAAEGRLFETVKNVFQESRAGNIQPVLVPGRNLYAAIPLTHIPQEEQIQFCSVSKMLDQYYDALIRERQKKQLRDYLSSVIKKRLDSLSKKQSEQKKELEAAAKAPQYRLYGELLLAYQNQISRGSENAVLPDLYNPDEEIKVPLDPAKSPSANAQRYFHRYRKARKSREMIRKQLAKTRAEMEYCRSLLYTIESSDEASLEEIRREMIDGGYIREKTKGRKKGEKSPRPLSFKTSSGYTVLVGKNNRQNDYITFKAAVRSDTWFHVRQLPGSHVVLKEAPYPPPPDDVEEAAFLAAYFSKGRNSSAAAVDYTEVRHVRRRPGGKPGFVFYENYETITVNPQNERMQSFFKLQNI